MEFIVNEGINAAKIVGFPEWIDYLLRKGFDVRLLLTQRDKETRNASANSMLLHLPHHRKVPTQERDILKRSRWLETHPELERLDVHFEKLVDRNDEHLREIVEFLRPDYPFDLWEEHLLPEFRKIIDPSRVKFRG